MSETPLPTNKPADEFNTVIKNSNSALVKVMESLIIARVPFLGLALPKFFLKILLGWLDGFFIQSEEHVADDLIIDTQVNAQMSNKAIALKNLLIAEKSGDPDAIKKAIQTYADANSALTHVDGVATLH